MHQSCHKCGEDLPSRSGETPFCPHCGTPQLTLAIENQSAATSGESLDGAPSTGNVPPPLPNQVDWPVAVRCALLVAAIGSAIKLASLKFDPLAPISFVWMISAPALALALYQKRRPTAWIDARVGTRIGLVAGLCLAVGTAIALAGWGLIQRFGLHAMGGFDAMLNAQIADGMSRSQQMLGTPIDPRVAALEQTPEFHAGFVLASGAMGAAFLLAISAAGGAFAGMLRTRNRRPA